MKSVKDFIKRNGTVFFLGFIILITFLAIIFKELKSGEFTPAAFKKVEEEVFVDKEYFEPVTTKELEFAPQIPSPENVGKPYFHGESNPNLRNEEGYPTPPKPGSSYIQPSQYEEFTNDKKIVEQETYNKRIQPTNITFDGKEFNPANATGYTGQQVIWTNKSASEIEINQVLTIHEALKGGIKIAPGQSYTFRPLVNGRFTYIEKNSQVYGTVYIADVTTPLL